MEARRHDAGSRKAAAARRPGSRGRSGADAAGKAAVAVDGDMSSQHALKWAADHVLSRAHYFYLLHVRRKHTALYPAGAKQFSTSHVEDDVAANFLGQSDLHTKDLMLPFQCFCSRRGLQCREIILDGTDVSKAIVDFVVQHSVDKIVLGASSRNTFTRTIRKMDVATYVTKYATNFCSVYVIAKGKLSSFRPATHANENDTSQEDLEYDAVKSKAPHKFPAAEPHSYRLLSTHAAMHIGANFRESTEEGNLMASDRQSHTDSSHLVKTSSCPNEFLRIMNPQGSHLSPEYPENHRDIFALPNKNNEHALQASHKKYLGIDDNALSLDYDVHPLVPSREHDPSTSNYQAEDLEDEMMHFKLEMKQENGRMLPTTYKKLPYKGRRVAEPSSTTFSPNHNLLTLESSEPDSRERTIEEFENHDSQELIHPLFRRRMPLAFYSSENDKHEPISKPLPRPIETKRILECLPTRLRCRIYKPEEIAKATENFSEKLKVGEGGYGPVYKATLDKTLVAIKILHSNVTQGLKQFQIEIDLLNNLRHPNMVHLVGACPEYGCLVYEYMPNGSLEDRLFCRSGTPPLPWQLRFKIAVEIARGLLYLHKMKPQAFVHRDLKPGNILLGRGFVTKIGDVGLARILPRTTMDDAATQCHMTDAAGTFCYIDPEYQKTGLVSTKSDVYALGIIYLQMITAKDAMGVTYAVSDALEEGTFAELLDPRVAGWPLKETKKFAELALRCCELHRRDRPDLESTVLPELVRLYKLAVPPEDPSMDQDQNLPRDDDRLEDNLKDGRVKSGSFSS